MINASQYSNLIKTVSQFLFIKGRNTNLLHGILESIFFAFDLVDHREGSFSQFGDHSVLVH